MNPINNRLKTLILLIVLLTLLGLGGIGGGIAMLMDPSGKSMGLPNDLLEGLPISSFLLPGIFLISVMGVAPFLVAWGLWKRINWAWMAALAQSVVLILWICFQIFLWGSPAAIQWVYLIWGIVMLGLCLILRVRGKS